MWLKKGHFGLSSQKASVAHSIQLSLEYVGYRFAEAGYGSLLNKNSLIHDFKIITGIIITTSDSSFGIGTLLNLALDPFEGSLDTDTSP